MDQMSPLWGPSLARDPIIALGALVLLALVGGEATARVLRLPRISGYALTGMALGAIGVLPRPLSPGLHSALDLCLGLVLFELGARIDLGWLRRAPWMAALAVAESACVGGALYALLSGVLGLAPGLAACGAAIGVSTSPAIAMRVAADLSAQGQVTERMLLLSATNSALAVLMLAGLTPVLSGEPIGVAVLHSLFVLLGSLALAAALATLGLAALRMLGKRRETQLVALIGLVALGVGIASSLGLSVALALLCLGAGLRSADRKQVMLPLDLGRTGQLFYLLLFALAAASLDLSVAASAGLAVALFLGVRALAKAAVVVAFAVPTRQPVRKAAFLALALQPTSGVAAILVHDASAATADLVASIAPFVLAAVALLELLGPPCVQLALRLAGEAEPEAA